MSEKLAQLENKVALLTDRVSVLEKQNAFMGGNPILAIQSKADLDQFDFSTGKGLGQWAGWALCNGVTYPTPNPLVSVVVPNLVDKFIVGGGGLLSGSDLVKDLNTQIVTVTTSTGTKSIYALVFVQKIY